MSENRYTVLRYYADGRKPRVIKRNLTEEQAKEHCNDPETSSQTATKGNYNCSCEWFDGFTDKY